MQAAPGKDVKETAIKRSASTPTAAGKDHAEITYIPGDHDPQRTNFCGIEFIAYRPVNVPLAKTVPILERHDHYNDDGNKRSHGVEKQTPVVELARNNPWFAVDGVQAARSNSTARTKIPADSDQYRGYALAWIAASRTLGELDERWKAEELLRDKCGLQKSDVDYITPFLEARRMVLGAN
jgi:hypothetical protein